MAILVLGRRVRRETDLCLSLASCFKKDECPLRLRQSSRFTRHTSLHDRPGSGGWYARPACLSALPHTPIRGSIGVVAMRQEEGYRRLAVRHGSTAGCRQGSAQTNELASAESLRGRIARAPS